MLWAMTTALVSTTAAVFGASERRQSDRRKVLKRKAQLADFTDQIKTVSSGHTKIADENRRFECL